MSVQRTGGRPLARSSNLVLGILLSGWATALAGAGTDELFTRYEVVTGKGMQQTVLSGFFLAGGTANSSSCGRPRARPRG